LRFLYVENLLHFNFADLILLSNFFLFPLLFLPNVIIEIPLILLFTSHNTKNIAYHIMEVTVFIFYADKLMMMGNSKNSRVFRASTQIAKI